MGGRSNPRKPTHPASLQGSKGKQRATHLDHSFEEMQRFQYKWRKLTTPQERGMQGWLCWWFWPLQIQSSRALLWEWHHTPADHVYLGSSKLQRLLMVRVRHKGQWQFLAETKTTVDETELPIWKKESNQCPGVHTPQSHSRNWLVSNKQAKFMYLISWQASTPDISRKWDPPNWPLICGYHAKVK